MKKQQASIFAPVLSAILLVGIAAWNFVERDTTGSVDDYMDKVRQHVLDVKYNIGPFLGSDAPVAPGAIKLLKPNIILQRKYIEQDPKTDQSLRSFSLLIVQCGVANDMYGHYPPACYPRAGWMMEDDDNGKPYKELVVHADALSIPAREYRFTHKGELIEKKTDILSFFIVPTGSARFGGDMKLVDMASRNPATAKLGAAQVQILTPVDMNEKDRLDIWNMVLKELEPVLNTIAEGA